MKKQLFALILVAQTTICVAQPGENKQPYMVKNLSNEHISSAEVQTSGGALTAEGVENNARIEVFIKGNGLMISKEEIERRLRENYDLNITVTNGKLIATARQKHPITHWNKEGLSIAFHLYIPKNASTKLNTSGGSISMSDLSGNEEFTTSGGSLKVNHLSGKINGSTSGGSIDLENSKDDIDLTTSGGNIDAKNCDGKLILSTSGGSLELTDLKGEINASTSGGGIHADRVEGELKATTSGGSIHMDHLSCSLETATSGGSIDVSITGMGKYVRISNSSGHVNLQIPSGKGINLDLEAGKINAGQLSNFNGRVSENEVKGKLNGGGIPVTVQAGGSRMTLTLK